jgi:hypothetical protein
MYVEVDFLLALIKGDDWLTERAETIYDEHRRCCGPHSTRWSN